MRKFKNTLINLSLSGVTLAILWILLEIVLRFLVPQYIGLRDYIVYHPTRGYSLIPNYSTTAFHYDFGKVILKANSRGMRDREYDWDNPSHIYLFGLGDSHAFGYGVSEENTFLNLLEHYLQRQNPNFVVLNAAVPGYGPDQELQVLREELDVYRPDWVLLCCSLGNDIGDVGRTKMFSWEEGQLAFNTGWTERFKHLLSSQDSFSGHWHTYLLLKRLVKTNPYAYRLLISLGLLRDPSSTEMDTTKTPASASNWAIVQAILREMKRLTDTAKARLVVLPIVRPEKPWHYRYSRLRDICGEEDIPFIETLPSFVSYAEKGEVLFFPIESHLSSAGHRRLADLLISYWESRELSRWLEQRDAGDDSQAGL